VIIKVNTAKFIDSGSFGKNTYTLIIEKKDKSILLTRNTIAIRAFYGEALGKLIRFGERAKQNALPELSISQYTHKFKKFF